MLMIDIDMPDNCDECRFNTECGFCKAMPDNFCGNTDNRKRPEWCPMKEQKAKYGYWINPTSQDCHCSECGEQPVHEPGESVPLYDFCPYCGAKMEVKWNEQP